VTRKGATKVAETAPVAPAGMTMRRALSDLALLGAVLAGDSWFAWRVMLIAMMGEALTDAERVLFTRLTGRPTEPMERVEEFWGIVGRRGGKSRAIAVLCIFIAILVDHSAVLVAGERPVVLCLAPSQKQAGVVLAYIVGILESVPLLAKLIANRTMDIITLTNGLEIEVRSANFRSVRGTTCVAVVADEGAFLYSEDSGSANPDTAILDALRPALATTNGLLAVISSPHARRGAVYDTWSQHYGEKGDRLILVAQGASRAFNPSLSQKVVDRAMERDPAAASAEYLGLFRSDLEAFVTREMIETAVSTGVHVRAPLSGVSYRGFVDPSGGSNDSMTMAIAHREEAKVIVDCIGERKAPFSPESVINEFSEVFKAYRIAKITGDRYGGEFPRELFRKRGISYEPAEMNRSELYLAFLPVLNSGRLELLDNQRMVAQFVGLERRVARSGKDSVDHAPSAGSHDDVANAVAGAVSLVGCTPGPIRFSDEFFRRARARAFNRSFGAPPSFGSSRHLGPYET
jgi:hypothetical protein